MDRFLSQFRNRFDAKGRVSLPAAFRTALTTPGFAGVFVHPSLDDPALDGGGQGLVDEIQAMLDAMPLYSRARDDLATALFSTAEILRPDSEGRIVLPERLRELAGLEGEALFVGQGRKFQIWAPERFAARLSAARERARDMRRQIGVATGARP